jgi:hypothetical protein
MSTQLLFDKRLAVPGASAGLASGPVSARRSILYTIAYADIFDSPLTVDELHRYLIAFPAGPDTILENVASLVSERSIVFTDGYLTLPGREDILTTHRRRSAAAERLWPRARRYGRMLCRLPFVRMVAVTGALAVDNVEPDADLDYLVVTRHGRLWLCRAMAILLVRLAALNGDVLCPNYFLSENALTFDDHNLYTAHELTQMVPLARMDIYHRIRQLNLWTASYLPNAGGPPDRAFDGENRITRDSTPTGLQLAAETILFAPPIGSRLERWEMNRKIRKFSANGTPAHQKSGSSETSFCQDWCKGHFDGHGQRTLAAFQERLSQLEIHESSAL